MTLDNNPIESGLDRFFKMGKAADYLGREALESIAEAGCPQKIVRLVVQGEAVRNPRETYPITLAGTDLTGCVTSITYSPRLECSVGMGYVPSDHAEVGTELTITLPDRTVTGCIANQDWQTNED
jgi:glycine cleavage system aminomethyltransferase T